MSEHMHQDGYRDIVNVDFSAVVNRKMFQRAPEMDWLTMDIKHLTFKDQSFDVVLEKGTLDALLVGEDVWDFSEEAKSMVSQVMDNVHRVLRHNGIFISVTFAQPHFRLPLLKSAKWKIEKFTFGDSFHYFFYVASKSQLNTDDQGDHHK
ncbi:hypothetical protein B566_EDAN001554 [Ephemera danica]|nr:hypothetical protein B566_EDAN001554 [Ephemera danica]